MPILRSLSSHVTMELSEFNMELLVRQPETSKKFIIFADHKNMTPS